MALSILEKVGLQKQAATLKSQLAAAGLTIMDKIRLQRELAAVLAKLKGEAKPAPAEGEDEDEGSDEEAKATAGRSIVGLAINGANHPAWARRAETAENLDLVLSNAEHEIAVLFSPGSGGAKRSNFHIFWPRHLSGTNAEGGTTTMSADNAWRGVQSPFPPKLRKKVRYMVEQAEREITRLTTDGISGAKVEMMTAGARLVRENEFGLGRTLREAYAALVATEKGVDALDSLNGESVLDAIQTLYVRADYALGALETARIDAEKEHSKESMRRYTPSLPRLEELRKLVEESEASQPKKDSLFRMIGELEDIARQLESDTKSDEKLPEPAPAPAEDQLVADYVAGNFSQLPYPDFRQKVMDVDAAGATLDQVKDGAVMWLTANADSIEKPAA
ncbi:hypothetical protein [Aeromonas sp. Y311-2]|uniref:hypothetical protein n=1 Tax=Aeromonas sp. Y311-2 TaxID=2990507 RepID=UPI0022E2D3C4|nr:hypothetical protein [Aeromonas sp. Y311-2]